GGPKGRRVAEESFDHIQDNHWLAFRLKRALPAGDYYLEASRVKGKVGWWSVKGKSIFGGQIFVNGRAETGGLSLDLNSTAESGANLRDFFSFRAPQPSYFEGPTKPDMWSWLEV